MADTMKSMTLSDDDWQQLLTRLNEGQIPDEEIGSTIVHLAKPFDSRRAQIATPTIVRYLDHPNSWARHEAMWFLRWTGLVNYKTVLIHALKSDSDADNRGYAALCLAHLLHGTSDSDAVNALRAKVMDESEDENVRVNSYGALIEIVTNRSGGEFFAKFADSKNFDWDWVSTLE